MSLAIQYAKRLEAAGAWALTEVRGRYVIEALEKAEEDLLYQREGAERAEQWRLLLTAVTEVVALMWAATLDDDLAESA
jgi:hypothetical protein